MKFPSNTILPGARVLSRRQWLKWGAAPVLASALPGCTPLGLRPGNAGLRPQLRLLGEERLPYHLQFQDTMVGGLSGLDHDPASGRWFALSDDRSDRNPARFYTLAMQVSEAGITGLTVQSVTLLRDAQGRPYPNRKQADAGRPDIPDPESIRFRPETGTLLWTSEGDVNRGLPPALREMTLEGRLLREFSLPEVLKLGADDAHGPRNNLTFEGLALSPSGRHAWVSMEAPLAQDGPLPTAGQRGGPCRLTRFDLSTGQADRQIAYQPDAVPRSPLPPGAPADNGISEILMADEHHLLLLERAYMTGVGVSLALYRIDTRQAPDTLHQPTLAAGTPVAAKTLVADFASLGLSRLDNSECLCWGPTLSNGRRSLVVLSDDNFSPIQITQFLAFEYQDASQ